MQIALSQRTRKYPYLLNNQNATNCIVAQTGANLVFISQLTKESVLRFTLNNRYAPHIASKSRFSWTNCPFSLISSLVNK
jgi:hypothetical protein